MPQENSETLYTVIITRLKPQVDKAAVAEAIARIVKNLDAGKTLKRLESLPWTMTRKASRKNAGRLTRYLKKFGCEVEVFPPLEMPAIADVAETQILPGTALLSETQVMSATQFMPIPDELSKSGAGQGKSVGPLGPRLPVRPAVVRETEQGAEDAGLEPLTLGGILDRTFQICRQNFWKLFAISAIPWLIMAVIALIVTLIAGVVGLTVHHLSSMSVTALIVMGVLIVPTAIVVFVILFYLAQGAMIHAVSSTYLGREIDIRGSYRFVFERLWKYALTSMLVTLMVILATVAAALAGISFFYLFKLVMSGWWSAVTWLPLFCVYIYVVIKLLLFDKVVIIEDIAYMGALRRSWTLLAGKAEGAWPRSYWVRLIILLNLFALISFAISWLFQTPASLLGLLLPMPQIAKTVLNQVLSSLGSVIGGIFGAVCLVVFYYDIRNRKEGFDLKMLANIDEPSNPRP
jgi:hypothetical protein